jgi:hypothetical protein
MLNFPDRSQGQCDEQAFTRESSVSTLIFTVVFYSYSANVPMKTWNTQLFCCRILIIVDISLGYV